VAEAGVRSGCALIALKVRRDASSKRKRSLCRSSDAEMAGNRSTAMNSADVSTLAQERPDARPRQWRSRDTVSPPATSTHTRFKDSSMRGFPSHSVAENESPIETAADNEHRFSRSNTKHANLILFVHRSQREAGNGATLRQTRRAEPQRSSPDQPRKLQSERMSPGQRRNKNN